MSPSSTPEASSDTTEVVVAPVYPSWREFWDSHSFSLPASPLDAASRLQQNLTHFHVNYLLLIFNITAFYVAFVTIPMGPIVYIYIVLAAFLASRFFYKRYFHPEPSNLERPHLKSSRILLVVYIVMATISSILWPGLPWTYPVCLFVTIATVVCLHGMLRVPIYDDQYQGLLDAQLQSHQPPQVDV